MLGKLSRAKPKRIRDGSHENEQGVLIVGAEWN
jgi:hypothetical protein